MKKITPIILVILLTGFIALAQQEKVAITLSATESTEKEAIMKVLDEETAAYYANDIERWAATYLQDSANVVLNANKAGYNLQTGWENILTMGRSIFNGNQGNNREVKTPLVIKITEGMAWVLFDNQVFNNNNQLVNEFLGTAILEKMDDSWKIIYRNALWIESYRQPEVYILNAINYAKSIGKSVEELAQFTGEQFKTGWNNENFAAGVINNWRSWTTPDNFNILEQDEDRIVFTADNVFSGLKMNSPVYNVTYDDYLTFIKAATEKIAEDLNVGYYQESTPNGIRVTLAKKSGAGK